MRVSLEAESLTTHAESFDRPEENSRDGEGHFLHASKKQATSVTTMHAEANFDELEERLGNFHESARALADCLQTRDVNRKTDQNMIEAVKCIIHKLMEEASGDLERVMSQSRKELHIETIRNAHRCPRPETTIKKPCSRSETLVEKNCSRSETVRQKLCCRSETMIGKSCSRSETSSCIVKLESASKTRPSCESLEQTVDDDFPKQLEMSVPLHKRGDWYYEFKMSSFTLTILNLFFAAAEQKDKTLKLRMQMSADKMSLNLKFNPWDIATLFRPE